MKRWWLLMLGVLLVGCGKREQVVLELAEEIGHGVEVEVKTALVEEREMPRFLRVIGELRSRVDARVAADGAGRVTGVLVERGSVVKVGETMIELDDRAARLSLREAEAQVLQVRARLGLAEAEWKRNEPLAKSKAIAEADFEKFTADLESVRADEAMALVRLDTARKGVEDLVVKAPFDGVVAERLVSVGEFVAAGREVVQLVSGGSLHLLMQVPETAVAAVKLGQEVEFRVPAFEGEVFIGEVIRLGAVVRGASRDMLVEAEVGNREGRLRQGMFAEGRLLVGREVGLVVPEVAVRREGSGARVLLVRDGVIEERLVELGETVGGVTEVFGGVEKGAQVVVEAGQGAVDGARIKLTMLR